MTTEDTNYESQRDTGTESAGELSRRDFVAMSVAAGVTLAATSVSAAEMPVVETMVEVKTPDGTCDAAFIHPATGSHPGVIVWPDAFGLRPSMRDIGKRIAAEGYSVLVPNPFYRMAKAPVVQDTASFNFQNPADMAKLTPLMASINAPGAAERDADRLHRLPGRAIASQQRQEDRHPGLLHGRPAGGEDLPRQCPIALAPADRSTAAAWSPTSPTARICSLRKSRRACISESHRMTTCASPTPKTS